MLVDDNSYVISIINYIHRNPLHHGLVGIHSDWKYSSYNDYLSDNFTIVNRTLGTGFFDSIQNFIQFHLENTNQEGIDKYIIKGQ